MYGKRTFLLVFIFCATIIFAQEVDVEELERSITDTVNFINYSGVHTGIIDSLDAIRGIGRQLGAEIAHNESLSYAGKYRITHILPSDNRQRGADVFELLPGARIDHIDNLRIVISAYLSARYAYSPEDSRLLGRLITIYNAVYRNNIDFFAEHYAEEVFTVLNETKVGLSLTYREWAGESQIIIPINLNAAADNLSSVPADELLSDAVEETLRSSENLGIEDRIEAIDLIDRAVDEGRTQIEEERERIASRQEDLLRESENLRQRDEASSVSPEREAAESDGERQTEQQAEQQAEIRQEQQELAAQQDENEKRQSALDRASERSSEIRRSVADDVGALSPETAPDIVLFTRNRLSGNSLSARIVTIDLNTGNVVQSTRQEIIGSNFLNTRNGLLAIGNVEGTARFILFDPSDLSVDLRGDAEMSRYSPIIAGANGGIYAITRVDSQWYLGYFDISLNLLFHSAIPVAEESGLAIDGSRIIVQRRDGRFTGLSLTDLRVAP